MGKDLAGMQNRPAGEVFECKYAGLPGGCGETVHCKSCTIRKTVMATTKSGSPCFRVPAYMDLGDYLNRKSLRFLVSTQQVGEVVVLRIDDAEPTT